MACLEVYPKASSSRYRCRWEIYRRDTSNGLKFEQTIAIR